MEIDLLKGINSFYVPKVCSPFGGVLKTTTSRIGAPNPCLRHSDMGYKDAWYVEPLRFKVEIQIQRQPSPLFGICYQNFCQPLRSEGYMKNNFSIIDKIKETKLFETKIELGNMKFSFSEQTSYFRETKLADILSYNKIF